MVFNYIENVSDYAVGTAKSPFADTDNEHVAALHAMGIISGESETAFAPSDSLTREEAAAILYRLIRKIYPNAAATERYFEFADGAQISDWAMSPVQTICNMGIMSGVGDNKFAPKDLYTAEQAIATLVRIHNNFES